MRRYGRQSLKYFLSGRVPDGKYFSGCKCGICMPLKGDPIKRNALYGERRSQKTGGISCKGYGTLFFCTSTICAQQTAKRLAESPEGDFRQTQRRPKPPLFYWYRFRTRTHLTADARWASAATSSKTGGNYTFSQSENGNRVRSLCSDDVRA